MLNISAVFEREHKIKRARIEAAGELKDNAQLVLSDTEKSAAVICETRNNFEKQIEEEVRVSFRVLYEMC